MRSVFDRCGARRKGEPMPRNTAAWYRWARAAHQRRYPDLDAGTRANLDAFVNAAEARARWAAE